jgi:Gametolysin peptidase M11/Putative metal-binding motif
MLPPPVAGRRLCTGCSLARAQCTVRCSGGCVGSAASTSDLRVDLRSCHPTRSRLKVTAAGRVRCYPLGTEAVALMGEVRVLMGHYGGEAARAPQVNFTVAATFPNGTLVNTPALFFDYDAMLRAGVVAQTGDLVFLQLTVPRGSAISDVARLTWAPPAADLAGGASHAVLPAAPLLRLQPPLSPPPDVPDNFPREGRAPPIVTHMTADPQLPITDSLESTGYGVDPSLIADPPMAGEANARAALAAFGGAAVGGGPGGDDYMLTDFAVEQGPTSGKDFVVSGQPVVLSSVTVIFASLCGRNTSLTPGVLRAAWFNRHAPNPASDATLERMFATCSHGTLLWPEADNHIIATASVPCRGVLPAPASRPYDLSTCGSAFFSDLPALARREAARQLPALALGKVKRLLMVLPPFASGAAQAAAGCAWSGMGQLGGHRRTLWPAWVFAAPPPAPGRNASVSLTTAFQELLHNTGLFHSTRLSRAGRLVDYGERPDPMGGGERAPGAASLVCPNAVQAYKAGWARVRHEAYVTPQLELDLATGAAPPPTSEAPGLPTALPEAGEVLLTLGATSAVPGGVAALRLVLGPAFVLRPSSTAAAPGAAGATYEPTYTPNGDLQRSLFLSYRARSRAPGGFDSGLTAAWSQRVYVHEFYGLPSARQDPYVAPDGSGGATWNLGTAPALWAVLASRTAVARLGRAAALYPVPKSLYASGGPALQAALAQQLNVTQSVVLDLGAGRYTAAGAGSLNITVITAGPEAATVRLCRFPTGVVEGKAGPGSSALAFEAALESCLDGIDNDCNGITDLDEPACKALLLDPFDSRVAALARAGRP